MELGIGMFGDLQIDPQTGKIQAPQERIQQIIENTFDGRCGRRLFRNG